MANSQIINLKSNQVNSLVNELKESKSFLFFEYLGIDAKDLTKIRRTLHSSNSKLIIAKNNIFNRALKELNINLEQEINGPCAIIIVKSEESTGFKIINDLIKEKQFIKFRVGMFDNSIVNIESLATIANLPTRNELYSQLLSCLQGSLRNLLYGLVKVSEGKAS